jgi:hypothetical protein
MTTPIAGGRQKCPLEGVILPVITALIPATCKSLGKPQEASGSPRRGRLPVSPKRHPTTGRDSRYGAASLPTRAASTRTDATNEAAMTRADTVQRATDPDAVLIAVTVSPDNANSHTPTSGYINSRSMTSPFSALSDRR